jgi:hypothetical protein
MMDRRHLLRIAAPAVALPLAASMPQAKEMRLVTRDEIMGAFRFYDGMELMAEDLNLRYQILIDMLFETNPEALRARLAQLIDNRSKRSVVVDANTGQVAPYDPSMYDELGHRAEQVEKLGRERVDAAMAPVQEQLQQVLDTPSGARLPGHPAYGSTIAEMLPKPKLRYRVAAWLMGWH